MSYISRKGGGPGALGGPVFSFPLRPTLAGGGLHPLTPAPTGPVFTMAKTSTPLFRSGPAQTSILSRAPTDRGGGGFWGGPFWGGPIGGGGGPIGGGQRLGITGALAASMNTSAEAAAVAAAYQGTTTPTAPYSGGGGSSGGGGGYSPPQEQNQLPDTMSETMEAPPADVARIKGMPIKNLALIGGAVAVAYYFWKKRKK